MLTLDSTSTIWKTGLSLALCGLFAAGCGSFEAESDKAQVKEPDETQTESQWILSVVDSNTYSVATGQTARLKVQLAHPEKGVQPGEVVSFAPGSETASSLDQQRAKTNDQGIASIDFRAGRTLETVSVIANHPKAAQTEILVEVTEQQPGKLTVGFDEPNAHAASLGLTRVQLHPSDEFSCSVFQPLADDTTAPQKKQVDNPDKRVTFQKLDPDKTYTVTARTADRSGLSAAAGCIDGVEVPAGDTGQTTIDLRFLPLDPAGTYELTSTWDLRSFTDIKSPFGERVTRIIDIVADPAEALFDTFAEKLEEFTSSLVSFAVKNSSIAADIKAEINDRLRQNGLPDTLRNMASSLQKTVSSLEIEGRLEISERGEDAKVSGRHIWETAYVQPPNGCNSESGACQKIPIELKSEVDGGLTAEWEGHVEKYNKLVIDTHTIRVDAGDLATKILEKVIIPQMTNGQAQSVEEAITYFFNCGSFASDLAEDGSICISGICVSEQKVTSVCESTVRAAFDVESFVDKLLDMNVAFEINGSARLTQRNARDRVKQIGDGSFEGEIRTIGDRTTSPANADWSAQRD